MDDCVRAVFLSLGGVISDRANRTALLDCPLARAWWRYRYATQANRIFQSGSVEVLSNALRKRTRWEPLVEAMISRLTVIGDSSIRAALVQCLADGEDRLPKDTWKILRWIGRRSTVQALGALEPHQIMQLVMDEFSEFSAPPH